MTVREIHTHILSPSGEESMTQARWIKSAYENQGYSARIDEDTVSISVTATKTVVKP